MILPVILSAFFILVLFKFLPKKIINKLKKKI